LSLLGLERRQDTIIIEEAVTRAVPKRRINRGNQPKRTGEAILESKDGIKGWSGAVVTGKILTIPVRLAAYLCAVDML